MAARSRQQPVLIPVQRSAAPIAPLLPIQRDRRSVSPVPVRRMTKLVVAFGVSFFCWLAVIAAVAALAHAL
jgi:hypothetical protein